MTSKQGQISRIDILQAKLRVDEEEATYIAQQLGLARAIESLSAQIIVDKITASTTLSTSVIRQQSSAKPLKPSDRPKTQFWYVHHREQKKPDKKKPLTPVYTEWQNRPQHAPQHQPLLSRKALLALLQPHLQQAQSSYNIDIAKVVKVMSRAEHLQQLPKQTLKSEQMALHLIDDRSRHLVPYWQDHHYASKAIYRHYTHATLSLSVLQEGCQYPQQIIITGFSEWQIEEQSVVLIFSDLGHLHSHPQRAANRWLTIGRALQRKQCKAMVLLPYAIRQLDPRFKTLFQCLSWEHNVLGQCFDRVHYQPLLEKLLVALSPSVRIEPSLLRAMRFAMQVHGKSLPQLRLMCGNTRQFKSRIVLLHRG